MEIEIKKQNNLIKVFFLLLFFLFIFLIFFNYSLKNNYTTKTCILYKQYIDSTNLCCDGCLLIDLGIIENNIVTNHTFYFEKEKQLNKNLKNKTKVGCLFYKKYIRKIWVLNNETRNKN